MKKMILNGWERPSLLSTYAKASVDKQLRRGLSHPTLDFACTPRLVSRIMREVIFIFCLLLCQSCFAVPVAKLYQGTVPVTSQAATQRQQAVANALEQVFVKVSGHSTVLQLPAVQEAVANANNYLQAYSYKTRKNPDSSSGLVLRAEFDGHAIQALLQQNQQSIWGKNRPSILVWLDFSQSHQALRAYIDQAAQLRGLPISYPYLDAAARKAINKQNAKAGNIATLEQIFSGYGKDCILSVRVMHLPSGQWQGQWTLLLQGQAINWQNDANTAKDLITQGINTTADTLATRYTSFDSDTSNGTVRLTVANIQGLADYAKVSQYLQNLTPVKQADVIQVTPTAVIYDLQFTGNMFALQQALNLTHHFQSVSAVDRDISNDGNLYYEWIA